MCSAGGRAVLRVLEKEKRQQHCADVGAHLVTRLKALQAKHDIIGDVRGQGLMLGVELVKDRTTKVRVWGARGALVVPAYAWSYVLVYRQARQGPDRKGAQGGPLGAALCACICMAESVSVYVRHGVWASKIKCKNCKRLL